MKISKSERVKIEQQEKEFKKWPGYRTSHMPSLKRFGEMHNFYLVAAKNINTPPELLSRMVNGIPWIADNKVSSKEYFCLGTDDTGQVMYKKEEDGKISFSFYWSHW